MAKRMQSSKKVCVAHGGASGFCFQELLGSARSAYAGAVLFFFDVRTKSPSVISADAVTSSRVL
jgi:hypothetical protein